MVENQKTDCLQAALQYASRGLSVIPVRPDKKPLVKWEPFQTRRASAEEIKAWWKHHPSANVAIVTGMISGLCVIDKDEVSSPIEEYLPDGSLFPTVRTPRGGLHFYFSSPEEPMGNNARLIPGADFRGQGGYVLAPPSTNGKGGAYTWIISLDEANPPPLPDAYLSFITNALKGVMGGEVSDHTRPQMTTGDYKKISEGQRDEVLFHIANAILNHSMQEREVEQLLRLIALHCCDPPFPVRDIAVKIQSVLNRIERRERNLAQEVREWAMTTEGHFMTTESHMELQLTTRSEKKACVMALLRLAEEGLIEKYGGRRGCYRRVDRETETIDFLNASTETVDLRLPFGIHEMVELMPGNIIVVAGEMNAGKTAFLLNVVHDNMDKMEVHFFSSEMGGGEMRKRLSKFEMPLKSWRFKASERSENFGDVIEGGPGKLNIIDFLELHENFYEVGGRLAEIHRKLNGALAIVALQKNPKTNVGLGGFRSLEKPRLYLAISPGCLKVVKAKNWATFQNPNGLEINFKLAGGCKFVQVGDWHHPVKESK